MELLKGVAAQLRLPGADEDPVAFSGPPTVTVIRDSDGAVVVDQETSTEGGSGEDVYFTVDIPGDQLTEPDLLIAEWTDGSSTYTTRAEVVGAFLASLKEIKEKLGEEGPSDERCASMREIASRSIEDACGVAFRPRYERIALSGTGDFALILPRPRVISLVSLAVDGEALSLEEVAVSPAGILEGPQPWRAGAAIEVAYVHGHETFPAAALPVRDLAAYLLTPAPTDWDQRATSVSSEIGTYSLVTPGLRGAVFPLPAVNAFVEEHRYPVIG